MILSQQEIVQRVEGLFALADQLEVRLAKARGQVDHIIRDDGQAIGLL